MTDYITPTNHERAETARQILTDYEPHTDVDTSATDLMADMMHLLGEDVFEQCVSSASMHYTAEVRQEQVVS